MEQPAISPEKLTSIETDLRAQLANFMQVSPAKIDFDQPLHTLGLGSLAAVGLKYHVEDTYGVDVPVEQFFEKFTVRQLIDQLAAAHSTVNQDVVDIPEPIRVRTAPQVDNTLQFSLFFFAANAAQTKHLTEQPASPYQLLLDAATFADQHNFLAIWLPERHFHAFGGLYPNPATLAAAIAPQTEQIRLRAGSVVLPLNHPIRVAEEWSMVDNLSAGRVDISFATGWNPNDFVLAPDAYADRVETTYAGIETIQKLWQGQSITLPNGLGQEQPVQIYPQPQQPMLNTWLTCSGGTERFVDAGARGFNVLTALLFQSLDELAEKIKRYQEARTQHGYDPATGHVTLMLHTYVGESMDEVRQTVKAPFIHYLETSVDLWRQKAEPLDALSDDQRKTVLDYAFERYFQTSALIGTPEICGDMIKALAAIGVNEIACLIDFGVDPVKVLTGLRSLEKLQKTQEIII